MGENAEVQSKGERWGKEGRGLHPADPPRRREGVIWASQLLRGTLASSGLFLTVIIPQPHVSPLTDSFRIPDWAGWLQLLRGAGRAHLRAARLRTPAPRRLAAAPQDPARALPPGAGPKGEDCGFFPPSLGAALESSPFLLRPFWRVGDAGWTNFGENDPPRRGGCCVRLASFSRHPVSRGRCHSYGRGKGGSERLRDRPIAPRFVGVLYLGIRPRARPQKFCC